VKRPQRPEPRTLVGQPPPQRPNEHLPDAFPDRERDRYASRALAYVILLNGAAALILVTALAFAPQSASDPRRLTWAMLVFGSGALAGLLSSLLAYIGRTAIASSYLIVQDVLRVCAIIAAVGSGAAFLTALNIMALMVPEASSTRPKSKPQSPTAPASNVTRVLLDVRPSRLETGFTSDNGASRRSICLSPRGVEFTNGKRPGVSGGAPTETHARIDHLPSAILNPS
jgi:hypothetical protein